MLPKYFIDFSTSVSVHVCVCTCTRMIFTVISTVIDSHLLACLLSFFFFFKKKLDFLLFFFFSSVFYKPLCRGLTLNRLQQGNCSASLETPSQKQVIYEWFSTRFPTNVPCKTVEGVAAFPARPHVPGRRVLHTETQSRQS